jgi:hypothetical protein
VYLIPATNMSIIFWNLTYFIVALSTTAVFVKRKVYPCF